MITSSETLPENSSHSPEPDQAPVSTDANPESSPGTTADATSDSSTESPGAKEPESMGAALDRAAADILKESGDDEAKASVEDSTEDSPTDRNADEGKETPEKVLDSKDEQSNTKGESKDTNVPFHEHPRWQEKLVREKELTTRIEQLEPAAEIVGRLQTYTGDEAGFNNAIELMRVYAESPKDAVPHLEQLLKDARERGGLVLTDDTLQEQVENGNLTEETALELQQGRKNTAAQQETAKAQQQQAAATQAQTENVTALDQWTENIRSRDPDFGVLTKPDNAEHGVSVADQVFEVFVVKQQMKPQASAQELVKMAQESYEAVKKRIGRFQAPPGNIRPLTSQGSSTTAKAKPKSMREAMDQQLPG